VRTNVRTFLANTINILLINEYRYRIRLGESGPKLHRPYKQYFALNKAVSLIYEAATLRPTVSKTEGQNLEASQI
jgi:hypothetical protein